MKKYPGVRYIEKDESGQKVFEVNFQLRNGSKKERFFFRVRANSASDALDRKEELRVQERQRLLSSPIHRRDASFEELKKWLLEDMKGGNLKKKTLNRALNTFQTFFEEYLGKNFPSITRLDDLTRAVFYGYRAFVVIGLKRELGWRSEISTLKAIINRLVQGGFAKQGIADSIAEIKKPKARVIAHEIIDHTEREKLLSHIKQDKPRYYGVTYFLARLGWRIEETLCIQKKNIKWENGAPVTLKLEGKFRKNGKDFVLLTIDEKLAEVIRQYALANNGCPWLFPNTLGKKCRADHYRNYLNEVSREVIGRKLNPHDFRRSLVTLAGRENILPRDLMSITGHEDVKTIITHYQQSTPEGRMKILKLSK